MKFNTRLGAVALTTALSAIGVIGAADTASAASASCTGTPGLVGAGAHVRVTDDSTRTFPSSCVRYDSRTIVRNSNGTYTTNVWTQIRDTAHDGQLAAGMIRFYFPETGWGEWKILQGTTSNEFWSNPVASSVTTRYRPTAAQIGACRFSSAAGYNACGAAFQVSL